MKDKLARILPFYFFLAGLAALLAAFYLFLIPENAGRDILVGLSARTLLTLVVALFLLAAAIFMGIQAYASWHQTSKLPDKIEYFLNENKHLRAVFWISIVIVGITIGINILSVRTQTPTVIFIRVQPVLFWIAFQAIETIVCISLLLPVPYRHIASTLTAFLLVVIVLRGVQKFLFPMEEFWVAIAIGLFVYALLDMILVTSGRVGNFFSALDDEKVGVSETLWFLVGPVLLALFMALIGVGKLGFLLPVIWLACSIQVFFASALSKTLEKISLGEIIFSATRAIFWLGSLALILWFYYLALISLNAYGNRYYPGLLPIAMYPRQNPLVQGNSVARGVWYTVPVEKSELYPLGYARFEDSVIDDIGHPFMGVLGSTLGFIQPCKSPFFTPANAVPMPEGDSIQPSFETTFFMLCPEWASTLPLFYSRIALLGLFLTAAVFGIIVWHDPIAFFVISLLLLKAWASWPPSSIVRPGQVEFVLIGLPLIVLWPYVLRHARVSTILAYSLFCGAIIGICGFVRQPAGLALLATSALAILFFAAFKHRRILIAITALLALLAGNQIMPTVVQGLFWYRDVKLQIVAPRISIASHGSGWNPLGGIGGAYVGQIVYPNALDMTHWDPILQLNGYNENPLIEFAINKLAPGMEISTNLLIEYIKSHPSQFIVITSEKTYRALNLMTDIPVNWVSLSYTLAILGSLSILLKRLLASKIYLVETIAIQPDAADALLVGLLLAIVAALPAIITDPGYSQAIYPAAAILFMITLIAVYEVLFHARGNVLDNAVQPGLSNQKYDNE